MGVIYTMDCVEGMRKYLADESVDLTVTSPPYDGLRKYNGYSWDFEGVAKELYRVTKQGGVVVWVVADQTYDYSESCSSFKQALYFKEQCGFNLWDTMIWDKGSPQAPTESRYYDIFEYMFVFSKGKPKALNLLADRKTVSAGATSGVTTSSNKEDRKYTGGVRTVAEYCRRFNIWQINRGVNKTEHPAVFPEQLAFDHIQSWSNPGDLVLDPFMGSGTTALMALKSGRDFVGFEISPQYAEIARARSGATDGSVDEGNW